jgi:hypothetical protein
MRAAPHRPKTRKNGPHGATLVSTWVLLVWRKVGYTGDMTSMRTRLYGVLLVAGVFVGILGASLLGPNFSPLKKALGLGAGSKIAYESSNSQCSNTADADEVYFVSCGGLF